MAYGRGWWLAASERLIANLQLTRLGYIAPTPDPFPLSPVPEALP